MPFAQSVHPFAVVALEGFPFVQLELGVADADVAAEGFEHLAAVERASRDHGHRHGVRKRGVELRLVDVDADSDDRAGERLPGVAVFDQDADPAAEGLHLPGQIAGQGGVLIIGKLAAVQDWVGKLLKKPFYLFLVAAAFVLAARWNGSVNMSVGDYGRSMALYLFVGTAGSLIVMSLCSALYETKHTKWLQRPLECIGRHTLPILCLHLFVYSVIGMVFGMLGITM